MNDPIRRRIRIPSCASSSLMNYIYDVPSLSSQLRASRFGALPPEKKSLSDSLYDEDDSDVVDPTSDSTLDRFERTDAAASLISERLKKSNEERLKHAEA